MTQKKTRKLPTTPRSRVRSVLRKCWLQSRERAAAIKRESNTCEECGKKGSAAKGREVAIEVHHLDGVAWEQMIDYVFRHLLVDPSKLEVLCKQCHKARHEEE